MRCGEDCRFHTAAARLKCLITGLFHLTSLKGFKISSHKVPFRATFKCLLNSKQSAAKKTPMILEMGSAEQFSTDWQQEKRRTMLSCSLPVWVCVCVRSMCVVCVLHCVCVCGVCVVCVCVRVVCVCVCGVWCVCVCVCVCVCRCLFVCFPTAIALFRDRLNLVYWDGNCQAQYTPLSN